MIHNMILKCVLMKSIFWQTLQLCCKNRHSFSNKLLIYHQQCKFTLHQSLLRSLDPLKCNFFKPLNMYSFTHCAQFDTSSGPSCLDLYSQSSHGCASFYVLEDSSCQWIHSHQVHREFSHKNI